MKHAVDAGSSLINDVYALRQPGSLEIAAVLDVPVCLMHMQDMPETMQKKPEYHDVLAEVNTFFEERIEACLEAGVRHSNIILDPGFGFGKTLEHNLILLANLESFKQYGCPILAGLSKKSMLGALLDKKLEDRTLASVTVSLLAVNNGASIVRVHDVAEMAEALKINSAVQRHIRD
jgi:dihydropteroate synthase